MKYKPLILILVSCIFFLTGCSSSGGIETKAYAVALGIDLGETNNIKLSLQIPLLNNSNNSSGGSQSKDSTTISVECSTIDSGISLINSYISKQIDLSHCKAVILSEELARIGVSDYIFTLVNNIELRPGCNIIISKCDAYDFLNNFKPVFESVQSKYYELILTSSEYTGYIEDLFISNFYANILNDSSQALAILGGISSGQPVNSLEVSENYKAESTGIKGKNNIESMGLAVFRGDKLVGELNNLETVCHLIISNKLENATITIPNPFDDNSDISLYISLSKNTENRVELINGFPYIKCKANITGNILSLNQSLDLSDSYTIEVLNSYVNSYLEQNISAYLYKTSKKFESDVDNFGRYLLPKYATWQDWIESDWLNNYKNAFFDIDVETKLQSSYLFTDI